MAKYQNSESFNLSAGFAQTALGTLRALTGADKVGRHDSIVVQVGTIAALALANICPKGLGNPADHAKVAQVFAEAKMQRYADACIGFSVALKTRGFRSMEWEAAELEGFAMADAMLADLRPKTYTKAEAAERESKAAERKAAKAKAAKAEAAKAEAEAKAKLETAMEEAKAAGRAEAMRTLTAQTIADLIRAGAFDSEGLAIIAAALKVAPVEVPTREVLAITG